jgi:magnesium transporter
VRSGGSARPIVGKPGQTLGEIKHRAVQSYSPDTSLGEAVQTALKTHRRIYPVVDEGGRMVGMVYGWQMFERVAIELSAQAGCTVGLNRDERMSTPALEAFRMRHPAIASSLFLTAFTDIAGMGLMLTLATALLL